MFATSVSVVERIIKAYEESHTVRVPRQGQGRSSDPRNFFGVAGIKGPANLLRLEGAYGAGNPDDLVADLRSRFLEDGFGLNTGGCPSTAIDPGMEGKLHGLGSLPPAPTHS